jgi:hypothetical protein
MKKIDNKGLLLLFPVGGSIVNYRKLLLELNDKVLCDLSVARIQKENYALKRKHCV